MTDTVLDLIRLIFVLHCVAVAGNNT